MRKAALPMRVNMSTIMGYVTSVKVLLTMVYLLFCSLRRTVRLPDAAHRTYTARVGSGRWLSHPWFHPLLQPLKSYGVSSLWESRYCPPVALPLVDL